MVIQPAFVGKAKGTAAIPQGREDICFIINIFGSRPLDIRQIPAYHRIQFPVFLFCYGNAVRQPAAKDDIGISPFFWKQIIAFAVSIDFLQAIAR